MLDAVAEKDFSVAVVAPDGHGEGDEPLGPLATLADGGIQPKKIRRAVELAGSHLENRVSQQFFFHGGMKTLLGVDGKDILGVSVNEGR